MSYYTPNPEEQPEAPRCSTCDVPMTEVTPCFFPSYWECQNLDCDDCAGHVIKAAQSGDDQIPGGTAQSSDVAGIGKWAALFDELTEEQRVEMVILMNERKARADLEEMAM
jgi:hypothetical protein